MAEPLRLRQLLERLAESEMRFVLVGGLAVNAWGYVRATRDIDLVPDPSRENLERLDLQRASERPRDRDDLDALEDAQGDAGRGA